MTRPRSLDATVAERQGLPGWWATTRPGRRPIQLQNASGLTTAPNSNSSWSRTDSPSWPWRRPGPGHHHRHGGPGHRAEADHHREQRGRAQPGGRGWPGEPVLVLGLHAGLRARSPVASGSARAFRPAFHAAGLPTPSHQRRCRCRFPCSTSILLSSSRAAASMHSSASGPGLDGRPMAFMAFCSFALGTTGDRPRERSRRPGSLPTPPAGQPEDANQPGRHALSARAAMTPCPAGAQVRRRAIPPRRDCSHRSVADRRNSSGRTSSPQRCMSSGPSGTPVSFGA